MSLKIKFIILLTISVFTSAFFIACMSVYQMKTLGEGEILEFRELMIGNKKQELKNYIDIAETAISDVYESAGPADAAAQEEVRKILRSIRFGEDGYYFVYTYDGQNMVLGPKPELEGKSLWDMKDANGDYLVRSMSDIAQKGGGYHQYPWDKPSKNAIADKLSYVVPLEKWNWFVGVGFYIDDIDDQEKIMHTKLNQKIMKLMIYIFTISIAVTILFIFITSFLTRVLMKNLDKTSSVLKEMAEGEGDLTTHLDESQSDEVGRVAANFNSFLGKLKSIIISVKDSAFHVASGATELATATEEISTTLQGQSMQVSNVASATEELSASSREVMNLLEEGADRVKDAVDHTNNGQNALGDAIDQVNGIQHRVDDLDTSITNLSASSDNIGNIIDVINDIADQTNLLALNAAIEAARAGEAGRGFAVVADEVRKLAERTQSATSEVSSIIQTLVRETKTSSESMSEARKQVETGVTVMNKTSEAFGNIVTAMQEVERVNGVISSAIGEQNTTVVSINDNAQSISAGLEQSAAAMHQITKTISELQTQADMLQGVVGKFRTD